jgi:GT2 family glycosyltransferase
MVASGVAIAVLTYRRPAHLVRALMSAARQRNVGEILVIDNAADRALEQSLKRDFPNVRYSAMPHNRGCDGRNRALRKAWAPIVITIDDDVELLGEDCASRALVAFESDDKLACLNFRILDRSGSVSHRDWCHPRPMDHASFEFETYFILEGACALRREAALTAGAYPAGFFLGHEGVDLAYRLIDRGWRVLYTPSIEVKHHMASEQRPDWRPYYYYTRNGIWLAYRHFPALRALAASMESTAKMAFFAARARQLSPFLRGFAAALRELPRIARQPLTDTALARLRAIRAERMPFGARITRHLRERIL